MTFLGKLLLFFGIKSVLSKMDMAERQRDAEEERLRSERVGGTRPSGHDMRGFMEDND